MLRWIIDSPALKAVVSTIVTALIGIFSGTMIVDITTAKGIAWKSAPSSLSFWVLLVLVVLFCYFQWITYKVETEIDRFRDLEFCQAYIRSQCLPELAGKYKAQIRAGGAITITQLMDEFWDLME
jgi:hypothetical protein